MLQEYITLVAQFARYLKWSSSLKALLESGKLLNRAVHFHLHYSLGDFKDTPSSRLTIDEFLKIDLEQEHDPPCYLETKKKLKQQVAGGESAESADLAKDGSEDEEVEEGSGFSGIKLNSVETIISKARTTEAFMNVPTAGLTDDLTSLATIGEQDDEGEEENGERPGGR